MSKRDIINEIIEVSGRRSDNGAASELSNRLHELESAFEKVDKNNIELVRYFPVAMIACIEGYFRMAIKELVDSGEPFLSNAEKYVSKTGIKLDFTILKAVHGKKITAGDFVSHMVSLSRLESIDDVMTAIIGDKFLDNLRLVGDRFSYEVMKIPFASILQNPDVTFSDVQKNFEFRHIICHELASKYDISLQDIESCFESCLFFLRASEEYVNQTIYPNEPLTQRDMNDAAGESLEKIKQQLNEILECCRCNLESEKLIQFNDAQIQWEKYRESWTEFEVSRFFGGSIAPLIYCTVNQAITEKRIDELLSYQKEIDRLCGDSNDN